MSDDGIYDAQHSVKLSEITWLERLRKITARLPDQAPLFAAVTISFWGVAEVISQIGGESLSLRNLALPALATAVSVAVYKAVQAHLRHVPDALAGESSAAVSAFRRGKPAWQFHMAREMLLQRIATVDRRLERIKSGAEFIRPQHLSPPDYLSWLQKRPELLQRLIRAVAVQCTQDLPRILATTTDETTLFDVKDAVEQLALLYEEAARLELEVRGIKPPEHLATVHRLMLDWSDPIRDGIAKFLGVLEAISKVDVRSSVSGSRKLPDFSISFDSPENVAALGRELQALGPSAFR